MSDPAGITDDNFFFWKKKLYSVIEQWRWKSWLLLFQNGHFLLKNWHLLKKKLTIVLKHQLFYQTNHLIWKKLTYENDENFHLDTSIQYTYIILNGEIIIEICLLPVASLNWNLRGKKLPTSGSAITAAISATVKKWKSRLSGYIVLACWTPSRRFYESSSKLYPHLVTFIGRR